MLSIDLNCDMGEGMDSDEAIMPYISSANIACGYHAGDEDTMRRTLELALAYAVAIGAHPSYPDRDHFGRLDLLDGSGAGGYQLRPEDLPEIITTQLGVLQRQCDEFNIRLHHVKPHGALYNRAAKDARVSALICGAIRDFDPALILYGPGGSEMQREALRCGLPFMEEAFADRTYLEDGSLMPRSEPDALIEDSLQVVRQVMKMTEEGKVRTSTGKEILLKAETICIHGDGNHAVEFATMIHQALIRQGFAIRPRLTVRSA